MTIQAIIAQQKAFAAGGQAKDLHFRIRQLRKLKDTLKKNESRIYQSLYSDMRKSSFETYMTELAFVYHEINDAIKNVKKWSKPRVVRTALANFPGKSLILPEPLGTTLIIGTWNYPYQLTLAPIVAAMAGGNTCIIKPSELAPQASEVMAQMINQQFDPAYLYVVEGGPDVTSQLLEYRFNKIFFTGSTRVGKIVAKAAAEHLTPVTLELGGKNPCLVFADADLKISAQRIVWGKFLNAGQTCLAPDYLLVEASVYPSFLEELKKQVEKMFGSNPAYSENYVRIISREHVQRLQRLINSQKLYLGGEVEELDHYIAPTILKDVSFSDEVMREEIFGPILPVLPFTDLDRILREIKSRPSPLALYLFTKNSNLQARILREVSFGGGCINDVIMHLSNFQLPFGGVGDSGMGSYHGEAGFKTFSHFKSILKKPFWFELPIKYAPYNKFKQKCIEVLLG